jgi:acetolactate decarboxylase
MKRCPHALLAVLALSAFTGCCAGGVDRDAAYQISTLSAVMEGVYDGETTFGQLARHGDFGIGTFNALDGEMIRVDGKSYQITASGEVSPVSDDAKTPFACVTFFDADQSFALPKGMDFEHFKDYLDARLPTTNLPYAIRITGRFSHVKTRSVPAQTKPYPRLAEVVKTQPTFEFQDVRGVMAGFRLPQYMGGINLPGYHVHFLNEDASGGGHVQEFVVGTATAEVDSTPRLMLALPDTGAFCDTNLPAGSVKEAEQVER